jgi:hypothetical protein
MGLLTPGKPDGGSSLEFIAAALRQSCEVTFKGPNVDF